MARICSRVTLDAGLIPEMTVSKERGASSHPPRLKLTITTPDGERRDLVIDRPFRIGRVDDCEVCIPNEYVSRNHAHVTFNNGQWTLRDLNSSNGIYVGEERVTEVTVLGTTTIRLGVAGPSIAMEVEQPPQPKTTRTASEPLVDHYASHYFGKLGPDETVGEHTMVVRKAFAQVQTKQKRKYGNIIAALVVLVLVIAGFAFYEHQQSRKQKLLAENLFYTMKSLDVDIANVERLVESSGSKQGTVEIRRYENRRKELERNYDQFLASLNTYSSKITPQQQVILRVARIFGECELTMPRDFEHEVEIYIQKWKSSGRLKAALHTAKDKGYTRLITEELLSEDLPPQFFYLALQESNFDPYSSGPPTRNGIAKGMWQFIPRTAVKYGLRLGPLANLRRPDPGDDRHHWDKETKAASRYLKDLYTTDAQASGLLVMACYNWGEDYVLPLVRSMPANPRERNFWRLLARYREKIPKETYDYVFSVASAAAIGEDPHLFGFDFENPLEHL
jgi:membrane-bound lytic murein transglycosylase D